MDQMWDSGFEPDDELAVVEISHGEQWVRAEEDPAVAHERRVRKEQQAQFKALKTSCQAIYGQVNGRPGSHSRVMGRGAGEGR